MLSSASRALARIGIAAFVRASASSSPAPPRLLLPPAARLRSSARPRAMVTLVVATSFDPASIVPASAFLAMPGWNPGPSIAEGMESFANGKVRLLKHEKFITDEDDLDLRWTEATGEAVSEVIFLSRHAAASTRPAITVHPIGVPHLKEGDPLRSGGRPGWAGMPNPRIGPWLRLLKNIAKAHGLLPEFEITLEATHHGPVVHTRTMFVEIGSTEDYWGRQDAAQVVAQLLWEGLGLGGGSDVGIWDSTSNGSKVLFGIGGGHYVPRHMDIVLKDGVWVGHLLAGHSVLMDDPKSTKADIKDIGGTWKHAIRASYEATKLAFPGGEVLAYIDQRNFKGWQRNAINSFLTQENIKIGKPEDF